MQVISSQPEDALARRFLTAVIEAAERVRQQVRPLMTDNGHQRTDLLPDPFRFRRVTGFPYLLIYNAE
jgi:hypothetical protein